MTKNKTEVSPAQAGHLEETSSKTQPNNTTPACNNQSNSTEDQKTRLHKALLPGKPWNTIKIRKELDILHPAARILKLKQEGHNIETVWTNDVTSEGKTHRVASYILRKEGNHE